MAFLFLWRLRCCMLMFSHTFAHQHSPFRRPDLQWTPLSILFLFFFFYISNYFSRLASKSKRLCPVNIETVSFSRNNAWFSLCKIRLQNSIHMENLATLQTYLEKKNFGSWDTLTSFYYYIIKCWWLPVLASTIYLNRGDRMHCASVFLY